MFYFKYVLTCKKKIQFPALDTKQSEENYILFCEVLKDVLSKCPIELKDADMVRETKTNNNILHKITHVNFTFFKYFLGLFPTQQG